MTGFMDFMISEVLGTAGIAWAIINDFGNRGHCDADGSIVMLSGTLGVFRRHIQLARVPFHDS